MLGGRGRREQPLPQPQFDALGRCGCWSGACVVMGTVPAVPAGDSCLSVCLPCTGLAGALEGEIGGVGAPWTCRDPQGDPRGLRGLLRAGSSSASLCVPPPTCTSPVRSSSRQSGTLPGLGRRAEPCLHPPIPSPRSPAPHHHPLAVGLTKARAGWGGVLGGSLPVPRPDRSPPKVPSPCPLPRVGVLLRGAGDAAADGAGDAAADSGDASRGGRDAGTGYRWITAAGRPGSPSSLPEQRRRVAGRGLKAWGPPRGGAAFESLPRRGREAFGAAELPLASLAHTLKMSPARSPPRRPSRAPLAGPRRPGRR